MSDFEGRERLAAHLREAASADDWKANAVVMRHVFGAGGFAAAGAVLRMPFDDHVIHFDPRDDKIGMTLLSGRPWQRHVIDAAIGILAHEKRLIDGSVFIDVGANIGTSSVYAMLSGHFANLVAVEPEQTNFDLLTLNLRTNGLAERATLHRAAMGDHEGKVTLHLDGKNFGRHAIAADAPATPAGTVAVRMMTLDVALESLPEGQTVGLIKIDVEGHELDVLKGAPMALRAGVPILVEAGRLKRDPERLTRLCEILGERYTNVAVLGHTDTGASVDEHLQQNQTWADFKPVHDQHDLLIY